MRSPAKLGTVAAGVSGIYDWVGKAICVIGGNLFHLCFRE